MEQQSPTWSVARPAGTLRHFTPCAAAAWETTETAATSRQRQRERRSWLSMRAAADETRCVFGSAVNGASCSGDVISTDNNYTTTTRTCWAESDNIIEARLHHHPTNNNINNNDNSSNLSLSSKSKFESWKKLVTRVTADYSEGICLNLRRRTSNLISHIRNTLSNGFGLSRSRKLRFSGVVLPSCLNMYIRVTTLVLFVSTVLRTAEACSSRSTPKPRPTSATLRPNITFPTYACPQAYATWYCLNGATCFTVEISESILYNCVCAEGYTGPRCEFKDLDGSYLPSREKVMIEKASIASGVTIAVLLMVIITVAVYIYSRRRKKTVNDEVDSPHIQQPFTSRQRHQRAAASGLEVGGGATGEEWPNLDLEAGRSQQPSSTSVYASRWSPQHSTIALTSAGATGGSRL